MSEQNKTLVRRVVEEVYNQGNLAVADELSASDLVIHQTSQQIRGRGRQAVRRGAASHVPRPSHDN